MESSKEGRKTQRLGEDIYDTSSSMQHLVSEDIKELLNISKTKDKQSNRKWTKEKNEASQKRGDTRIIIKLITLHPLTSR